MSELRFKGNEFVYKQHLSVSFRPVVLQAEKEIGDPSLAGNLIIHGDNPQPLRPLLPLYAGNADCILIDAPNNTGKEGCRYNDNANAPIIREWMNANPLAVEDDLQPSGSWNNRHHLNCSKR